MFQSKGNEKKYFKRGDMQKKLNEKLIEENLTLKKLNENFSQNKRNFATCFPKKTSWKAYMVRGDDDDDKHVERI